MAQHVRKGTEICATCWYSGGIVGYRIRGKNRNMEILCRYRHEVRMESDGCPKYLNENTGIGECSGAGLEPSVNRG